MTLGLSLGALAGLQLLAGLALQLIVLRIVGAGAMTDAFIAAQTVPMVLGAVFATSLQSVWQPRFAVVAADATGWQRQQRLAQGQTLWLMGLMGLLAAWSSPIWLRWLFPGLDAVTLGPAVQMTRVMCAGALLNGHALLLMAALRSRERFVLAEVVAAGGALMAVAGALWIVPRAGVIGAAWVGTARAAAVCAVLFVLAGAPLPALRGALRSRETWPQLRPLLAGASLYKLSPLVDRYWGSLAPAGGLTLLALAQTGLGMLAQMLDRAICVPVMPRLARLAAAKQSTAMRALVRERLATVTWIAAAVLALLVAARPLWPGLLDAALRLPAASAATLWWLCVLLLGYLHVVAAGSMLVAAFVALGDSRTPVRIGVVGFALGLVVKSLAFVLAGLEGLALATSLYYVGNLLVMWKFLEKRLESAAA